MKKASLSALLLTIALSSTAFSAHALQTLDGAEGKKHVVRVPARELTRIAIENGRLQSMRYVAEELEVIQDKDAGSAYVKPRTPEKQISVFVISASGATHELILQPVETMPLESIVIKDPAAKRGGGKDARAAVDRANSMDVAIKKLMLIMARGDSNAVDAGFERLDIPLALWNEARFVLTGRYRTRALTGETFRLSNVSTQVMRIAEQELYKPGVVAVAVDSMILRPGESTDVYVIRVASDE